MIVFDPRAHCYKNELTNEEYISATTLLNKYKKPFDRDNIAKKVAAKENVSVESVLAKWEKINSISKTQGTKIHEAIELYNKDKTVTEEYSDIIESYSNLGIISDKDELLVEEKVYNHNYRVAGTVDIIRNESKGSFSIFDIKTNKKFNFFNAYSEMLLHPLSHLSNCEYSLYSLQLSLYAYMYQQLTGRRINTLGIIYCDVPNKSFNYYPANYLKTDIINILEHYAKSKLG